MLRDGRAQRRWGVNAIVAYRERHGRAATAAQLADLEVLPTRTVTYRGASFTELDVTAVLDRRPELALVDELAHANLPGERHAKRWHDVRELLANGIDVYTTVNVANIESLGALVSRITGVHPAEPVPDTFARAGEIKLVDLAPAALRRRLAQGLVVPQERIDAALSSYFRFANLAALRELAQLWVDDTVPDPVTAFLAAHDVSEPVQASVIMVGLEGSPADEWLIRYAANLAGLSDARLQGVHVRDLDNLGRPPQARLERDRRLLSELHGTLVEVRAGDVASGLIQAARQARACQLVIGSRRRSRSKFVLVRAFAGSPMRASKRRNSSPRQLRVASTSTFVVTSNTFESERVRETTIARPNSTCMSLASVRRAAEKASHPVIAHARSAVPLEAAAASANIVDRNRILTPSAPSL